MIKDMDPEGARAIGTVLVPTILGTIFGCWLMWNITGMRKLPAWLNEIFLIAGVAALILAGGAIAIGGVVTYVKVTGRTVPNLNDVYHRQLEDTLREVILIQRAQSGQNAMLVRQNTVLFNQQRRLLPAPSEPEPRGVIFDPRIFDELEDGEIIDQDELTSDTVFRELEGPAI